MKISILTTIALLAFAGNSVLCRLALGGQLIDANSFTIIRLISGAITLLALLLLSGSSIPNIKTELNSKTLLKGGYLFFYAALFSYAYIILDTASGALLLFASVQFTMIFVQFVNGNKPSNQELTGLFLAIVGFVYWMLPSSQSPSLLGAILMVLSGVAWAGYTLAGKHSKNAKLDTTKNFIISLLFIVLLLPGYGIFIEFNITSVGLIYAVASGSLASGIGYWIWYSVLPNLSISSASVLQLLVPILAAFGGFIWTGEAITGSFILACILILAGILLVVNKQTKTRT
ncbi:MAG: drug/metabolite transporter (DMT)-like permease [Psychrobacter glaciei]